MKIEQRIWEGDAWKGKASLKNKANLLLAFGHRETIENPDRYAELKELYPNARIVIASTSGEIHGTQVNDQTIIANAIQFDKTSVQTASVNIGDFTDSRAAGQALVSALPAEGLRHVLIISDGSGVNGTDLIGGVNASLPDGVSVTGGLAGDGAKFEKTLVGLDETPVPGRIAAVGLYGEALKVGYASMGGWDSFGPQRKITKATANVLYELDGKPALELYKTYLGEKAAELPGSGLLFPLNVSENDDMSHSVVRTLLAVDEGKQSMTFAGNLPEGGVAQLMKANFDRLVDGASTAAEKSFEEIGTFKPEFALLISCVGRKLILGQRIEDEVEAVQQVVGAKVPMSGFYSYGELAPDRFGEKCYLHNQTMTITLFSEN